MKDYTSICKAMKVAKPVKIISLCQKLQEMSEKNGQETPSLLSYDKMPREAELTTGNSGRFVQESQ